ncbi:maleylacetate reductase [Aeromicrobium sp. CTD01-1L150]|uniref:maleylacetate reductase n=1 Tax=Aeromicrobium sp. CTD01-1L150 TaxID=3341830 RepID=UPI0035C14356
MQAFVHSWSQPRVVFGRGNLALVAQEVGRLGATRAVVVSTPAQTDAAEDIAARLGSSAAAVFADAAMHTPLDVTEQAIALVEQCGADSVVAVGGGSATGLAKAIASRTNLPQVIIPTTYAGSEVTPILGETADGIKQTRRGESILPDTVIYDPDLTSTLPSSLAVTSGLNAMAHAAEGLYAHDSSPVHRMVALEGLRALRDALRRMVCDPDDSDARDEALFGAWLCGAVLGGVSMSIHHKLCHTLGGALDLPHADTHAILLPHTITFVEQYDPAAVAAASVLFGDEVGAGIYDFARDIGAPLSIADLGVRATDIDDLAELATREPYPCPRPLERDAIADLLTRALTGERPRLTKET